MAFAFVVLAGGGSAGAAQSLIADFEAVDGPFLAVAEDGSPSMGEAHIDEQVAHSGDRSLRVRFTPEARGGLIDLAPFPVTGQHIPDEAWGVEFWCRTDAPQRMRFAIRMTEQSGEIWDADVPFSAYSDDANTWHRVRVPFGWFRLITWERRDGRLNTDELESISLSIRGFSANAQPGTIWIDSFRVVDAVYEIPSDEIGEGGFLPLNLETVFDSDAIAWRRNPTDGDFHTGEWEPRTLPAESFPTDEIASLAGIPFRTPPLVDGANNHVRSNGQEITGFPPHAYTTAFILASGKFGDQMGDVTLRYADGSSEKAGLRISDWSMRPQYGESVALLMPHAYHRREIDRHREPRLFAQSLRVDPARRLESIRLPNNDFLKVFGITLSTDSEQPTVGEFSAKPLAELDPRLHMAEKSDIDFTQPVRPVGVLGGYVVRRSGSYGLDIPTFNGFLTFVADARHLPQGLLEWHRFQNRSFRLGGIEVFSDSTTTGDVEFLDSVTLRYFCETNRDGVASPFSMVVSRAWPAALYEVGDKSFTWIDSPEQTQLHATMPTADGISTFALADGVDLPLLAEPWLLLWHHVPEDVESNRRTRDFASPMLLVLERRPESIVAEKAAPPLSARLHFNFDGPSGRVAVMPLQGIRRVPAASTRQWASEAVPADVIEEARTWSRRLQHFPVALHQQPSIDVAAGKVQMEDRFEWKTMESEWDIEGSEFTPLSPTVLLAADNGYEVDLPADLVRSGVSTFYGPLAGRVGDSISYQIPLADYVSHMPTLTRATGHPQLQEATARLDSMIDEMIPDDLSQHISISDIGQDVAQLRLLGPSRLVTESSRNIAEYSRAVLENAFQDYNLKLEKEPLTGQYYLMDDRFWAKDALYDKEWLIGFLLQGLWAHAYYNDDREFITSHWVQIRGLYRYYQLVFDWATNSTFTMTTGVGANSDGVRIAYEGMLAMTRLAEMVGDEETREDGLVRTARQQLSLYASWFAAEWAAEHDYVMSRQTHVPPEDAELRFSPDHLWSEHFTTNTAFPEDFFQTNHAFFVFNIAHLMFLHDAGIAESRLREWIFATIPELHPDWCDGNAREEVGGRYYGDAHAMSLLIARAMLFEDTLEHAMECLQMATDGTAVMEQWYRPTGLVPMMLAATITGSAPRTLIPVESFAIVGNSYDVQTGEQVLVMEAFDNTTDTLRIRVIRMPPQAVTINGGEVAFHFDEGTRHATIPLQARSGERLTIVIRHVP